MAVFKLDAIGLRCPQPVLKLAAKAAELNPGDVIEITGDCPTLEKDVRAWCERMGKTVLSVEDLGGEKRLIKIRL